MGATGKWLGALLIGSLAFNVGMGTTFGVRAYNRHCGRMCESGCGARRGPFLEELNLRPDQLAQVEAQSEALHAKLRELHDLLAGEGAVLADLLVAAQPDREAVAAQLERLAAMHKQKQQEVVDHFLRFSELLDDRQRDVLAQTIRHVFAEWGAGPPCRGRPGRSEREGCGPCPLRGGPEPRHEDGNRPAGETHP